MARRTGIIILALTLLLPCSLRAQEIVIDPSQIAASATNAAEQVDYMLDQLGELAHLGEQMSTVRDHFDQVFGEEGIGGKAINVMQDLGTLARLTETYNSTMKSTEAYARQMQELGRYRLSDAAMMLSYIRSMQRQMEMAVQTARKILETLGFTKKEKKDELEKIITEMEKEMEKMDRIMEIETEATMIAEGLSEFIGFIDEDMTVDNYVSAKSPYGTLDAAGEGAMGVISLILGLFCMASAFTGFVIMVRGGILGDPVANNAFLRVAVGLFIGLVLLNLLGSIFGYNL